MNVLVIGSGGREHALAWKIKQSSLVDRVFVAPGNAGTALDAENVPLTETDFPGLIRFAKQNNVKLTVVGPELPLTLGIVDAFESERLRVFGPNRAAAQLEGSKIFCKEILKNGNIPTGRYNAFYQPEAAIRFLESSEDEPFVVKVDGLAAGKGVFVCDNRAEALGALQRIREHREFGEAGDRLIIEERLIGEEASVLAITDGQTIVTLQPAQDHKAAFDDDQGPNTGGMGAYCPATLVDDEKLHWIEEHVLVPTVHSLNRNETPFRGVLYAGLMMTENGPKVLEYNARFGDPECQPLLMRLQSDLVEIIEATLDRKLDKIEPLRWDPRPAVCVVVASKGYPGSYEKGLPISGLEKPLSENVKIFHSGTKLSESGEVLTNGGRVLAVSALGDTIPEAKKNAYDSIRQVSWDGCWFRKDISDKAV